MTTSLEVNSLRCMNSNHFNKAEELIGHPITDSYTMNAFYDKAKEVVTLKCYWCGYETEVDVSKRPVQLKRFSGKYITIGPTIK